MRISLTIAVALSLLLASCAQQTAQQTVMPGDAREIVRRKDGDTTSYVLEFVDKKERMVFVKDLAKFLESYTFDTLKVDTVENYVLLRVRPVKDSTKVMRMTTVDDISFEEADIVVDSAMVAAGKAEDIDRGGSLVFYSDRTFIDPLLRKLINAHPFEPALVVSRNDRADDEDEGSENEKASPVSGYLTLKQISPHKVKVTIAPGTKNAKGQSLTAFDIVDAWTNLAKTMPAEANALFGKVKGFDSFVRGREAVIHGLQPLDENTIGMRYETADEDALDRLATVRLLPAALALGPYTTNEFKKKVVTLEPNSLYPTGKPYLDKLTLTLGGDKNSFVTFSLNKYDAITLTTTKDVDYARRNLAEKTELIPLTSERYFIALHVQDEATRRALWITLDPDRIRSVAVDIDAQPISLVEKDETNRHAPQRKPVSIPPITSPLRIFHRADDPVSVLIAEKLLAYLSQRRIPSALQGLSGTEYEKTLYTGDYEIAVGWVPRSVLSDRSEQLRLSSMWFSNEQNEEKRIENFQEVPLFAVRRHALCKKYVGFAQGKMAGIYRRK